MSDVGRTGPGRTGRWVKLALALVGVAAIVGVASVLLDPGLGTPDESRRVKHPSGFSAVPPRGWGGSVFYGRSPEEGSIRISPERSTGRQPSLDVSLLRSEHPVEAAERATTFQGQPARLFTQQRRYDWIWRLRFTRDARAFQIQLSVPIELDVERSPYAAFVESFRVVPILSVRSAGAATGPSTAPLP